MQKYRLYPILLSLIASFIIVAGTAFSQQRVIEVKYTQLTKEAKTQVDCLAENIYYEAGYEKEDGQIAVALVTLNRASDPRYPKDICSVVKQKIKSTCQFTWYCEAKRAMNAQVYDKVKKIAIMVYANYGVIQDITNGALYYHADYVDPKWKLEKTAVIGRHIFYKEKVGI